MTDDKKDTVDIGEVLVSYEIALQEQGRELQALKQRIAVLEYAVRQHVTNVDTAHKV